MTNKAALIILDGWGIEKNESISAIAQAETPFVDGLYEKYTHAELVTYGEEVGLPEGQMGNSEVGHLNIGAGRVVYQDLARINKEIREDKLKSNSVLIAGIKHAKATNRRFHLMGLLSDGGVHSHINHLFALCDILAKEEIEVYIHVFLDGRDTDPRGGIDYVQRLMDHIKGTNIRIATLIGRYYAMDRDNRWERIKKSYDLLVNADGEKSTDAIASIQKSYDNDITDEFLDPLQMIENDRPIGNIRPEDTILFYNYRTDRPRELTKVLTQIDMPEYGMQKLPLYYMTMTSYDAHFKNLEILYQKDNLVNTLGEVVSAHGRTQVRIAETEKYPHVTFFFSGGREEAFEGESRIIASSPKVATYDLQPEMSAQEVTEKLIHHVHEVTPDFICLNYANTDMVGHTGIFEAAVKAVETVDGCLSRLVPELLTFGYDILIIADHGNSDIMKNPDGSPHTAHTTNMVPVIFVTNDEKLRNKKLKNGKLGDIAPTILDIMGIDAPVEMTGKVILVNS